MPDRFRRCRPRHPDRLGFAGLERMPPCGQPDQHDRRGRLPGRLLIGAAELAPAPAEGWPNSCPKGTGASSSPGGCAGRRPPSARRAARSAGAGNDSREKHRRCRLRIRVPEEPCPQDCGEPAPLRGGHSQPERGAIPALPIRQTSVDPLHDGVARRPGITGSAGYASWRGIDARRAQRASPPLTPDCAGSPRPRPAPPSSPSIPDQIEPEPIAGRGPGPIASQTARGLPRFGGFSVPRRPATSPSRVATPGRSTARLTEDRHGLDSTHPGHPAQPGSRSRPDTGRHRFAIRRTPSLVPSGGPCDPSLPLSWRFP